MNRNEQDDVGDISALGDVTGVDPLFHQFPPQNDDDDSNK